VHDVVGSGILPTTAQVSRMPNRPTGEADLVPTDEAAGAGYDQDFYTWTLDQARLIREGRWAAIDRENVAEEIESLGKEQFAKLRSAVRVLLLHMLKWDHQPDKEEPQLVALDQDTASRPGGYPGRQSRLEAENRRSDRKSLPQGAGRRRAGNGPRRREIPATMPLWLGRHREA